jgi:hypothetical protein
MKVEAINALDDATNAAALKGMKSAIGQKRQIPGLVPTNALRGDVIALMPHSNVPVVLRPVDNGTVHFIGETCIYIHGRQFLFMAIRLNKIGVFTNTGT